MGTGIDGAPCVSRDHRKLDVFRDADGLVEDIYRATKDFPASERFGLQTQIRRSCVSTATNIVEGAARRGEREFVNFLNSAAGSAAESRYLIALSARLGFVAPDQAEQFENRFRKLCAQLESLIRSLRGPAPEA